MASSLNQPSTNLRKPPRILSWLVGIIVVLFAVGPLAVSLYTDWQWFGEVDFRGVYTTAIITRIILFFAFGIVAGLVTFLISWLTWKNRPSDVSMADVNSPVYQYRDSIAATMRKFLYGAPLIIALAAGFMGQAYWRTVLLFLNGGDFGREDAEFGMDLGFYAFNLPLLNILVSSLSVLLIISFVLSLVGYYILGGIRVGSQAAGVKGSVSKPARIQLAVIAGLWMLVQVASYFLDRYTILFNQHDIFAGASFTNLHADLPAKIILIVVSALVAVAFFMAIVIKDLRIPGLAVVLMLVTSIAVGTAWPMLMEQFSVQPNRALKEAQSIERNIEATRFAYNIDETNVEYETNWGAEEVSDDDVAADENTISNLRLLDPDILAPTLPSNNNCVTSTVSLMCCPWTAMRSTGNSVISWWPLVSWIRMHYGKTSVLGLTATPYTPTATVSWQRKPTPSTKPQNPLVPLVVVSRYTRFLTCRPWLPVPRTKMLKNSASRWISRVCTTARSLPQPKMAWTTQLLGALTTTWNTTLILRRTPTPAKAG